MKKQKVKFNNKGAYMTHYGKRIYLDEVMRIDNKENDIAIGYYGNNYKIYILGYDDDGDAVGMVEFIGLKKA